MNDHDVNDAAGGPQGDADHWLVRPKTIRLLWVVFIGVLAATVLAEFAIKVKGYFGIDDWFGFGAVYGFGCCVLMVFAAKLLGFVLKRPDDYYHEPDTPIGGEAERD
jgi:hypothetical protein